MSANERVRLDAMHRVERNEVTVVSAAVLMCLSLRQARRLWKRYRMEGAAGLTHRSRGRASNRRLEEGIRERIVKRHQERYADFGATLACEKLAKDGMVISPDTLVALLKERHLWQPRRRRGKHRLRRARRASFGSMIQMDGSHHDWFEGRSGWCVLMVLIDDASNQTYARFYSSDADIFEVANQFLLLGIYAYHRQARVRELRAVLLDVLELLIPVGMRWTGLSLAVGFQREFSLTQ